MRAILQRVTRASVVVDGQLVGAIDTPGILAFVGVTHTDTETEARTIARKIAELRILPGERSALDAQAPVLVVSQFTLYGSTTKGRRPSWSDAAPGAVAEPLIDLVVNLLREQGLTVATGQFGAHMRVESVNDGPFTVLVEA